MLPLPTGGWAGLVADHDQIAADQIGIRSHRVYAYVFAAITTATAIRRTYMFPATVVYAVRVYTEYAVRGHPPGPATRSRWRERGAHTAQQRHVTRRVSIGLPARARRVVVPCSCRGPVAESGGEEGAGTGTGTGTGTGAGGRATRRHDLSASVSPPPSSSLPPALCSLRRDLVWLVARATRRSLVSHQDLPTVRLNVPRPRCAFACAFRRPGFHRRQKADVL